MHRIMLAALAAAILLAGCNTPNKRLNAPPHGQAAETSDLQGTYTYMTDNALLADMTINDSHFLPHRVLLNDLGLRRLDRLAMLIDAYGGTIRLSTNVADEGLIDARMEAVVDYLTDSGIDTTREIVVRGQAGGEGMSATEAILIKQKEGTYDPKKKKSSGGATPTSSAK